MRIRNRKVPLPLLSLSPIPLSDPQFSRSPVVPHQSLLQEPQKDEYFDPHLPSDRLNQPIGGGSKGHDDCSHGARPQEEKKVLLEEGDGIKGRELGEKSNDTSPFTLSILANQYAHERGSFLSEGVHITVLQQSSSSHQGVGRWGEGEKAFPLKKRRGSFERRSNEEMIMDRNKKMKTKMKTNMNTCVQQNGDNEEDEKETKEGVGSNVKTKPKGGVLLEGSRCSHANGKGRLRSMNSVRSRSIASIVPNKDASEEVSSHSLPSQKKEETKRASLDYKVSVAYDEDDKEKPLVISKRKMKLGVVKARSMSSLLGQANNAVGVAENNG
ncbi:hypothetical protein NC653_036204 [Populus alba x Populus x berolinensis]|uniref:Uncharacterized protein n=1 Tax=Populus alba x Populus x berolinensis TaxID=444605 RepID=A0AAD6LJ90_9ROSI|nr:hypothetical protein NC653_036204 [Populus alba x Populus x berolinensis]